LIVEMIFFECSICRESCMLLMTVRVTEFLVLTVFNDGVYLIIKSIFH